MKIIIVLLVSVFFTVSFGQVDLAKKSLLELEKNIYQKKFSKKWQKLKQSDWEKKCVDAESVKELNVLFNEYSDLHVLTTNFSMGSADATNQVEFLQYLLRVNETLPIEYVSNWSGRSLWKSSINEYLKKEEEKREKELQMERLQKISKIIKEFEVEFQKIWEDSKKNEFESILTGDAKIGMNNCSVDFKSGDQESIKEDKDGVRRFRVFFDAEGDVEMAKKIYDELMAYIQETIHPKYKGVNVMDKSCVKSLKVSLEYNGEKFSETAKRPTVEIGIKAKTPGVIVEIIEPLFGH